MSATNRRQKETGEFYKRHSSDLYHTPLEMIRDLFEHIPELFEDMEDRLALDPCAGGLADNGKILFDMPYPTVLKEYGWNDDNLLTLDVREDSIAEIKHNFLTWDNPDNLTFDLIITNPPFLIAEQIARKCLDLVCPDSGKVILLQRFDWFGSKERDPFFKQFPLSMEVSHAKRPAFGGVLGKDGLPIKQTDSCYYSHYVWDNSDKSNSLERGHQRIRIQTDYSKTKQTLF